MRTKNTPVSGPHTGVLVCEKEAGAYQPVFVITGLAPGRPVEDTP